MDPSHLHERTVSVPWSMFRGVLENFPVEKRLEFFVRQISENLNDQSIENLLILFAEYSAKRELQKYRIAAECSLLEVFSQLVNDKPGEFKYRSQLVSVLKGLVCHWDTWEYPENSVDHERVEGLCRWIEAPATLDSSDARARLVADVLSEHLRKHDANFSENDSPRSLVDWVGFLNKTSPQSIPLCRAFMRAHSRRIGINDFLHAWEAYRLLERLVFSKDEGAKEFKGLLSDLVGFSYPAIRDVRAYIKGYRQVDELRPAIDAVFRSESRSSTLTHYSLDLRNGTTYVINTSFVAASDSVEFQSSLASKLYVACGSPKRGDFAPFKLVLELKDRRSGPDKAPYTHVIFE